MKKMLIGLVLGTLALAVALPGATIRQRQRSQQARIAQGIRSGSLTAREAGRLEREQAALNRRIRRDRVDGGGLTLRERRMIDRQQDRLSRRIYRQKHDRQRW